MNDNLSKSVVILGAILGVLLLAFLAYSHPGYFTSQTYLGGLLLLEFLLASIWAFRRIFFPLVILTFFLAGVNLPVGGVWNIVRWFFLCAGFLVGSFIMLKERRHRFGLFHALALFAVLSAVVSSSVSRYPDFALLKAAVPLAKVTVAGLLHAGFENWLFAPGYYLCVFFWSLAFVFVDLVPTSSAWHPFSVPQPRLMHRRVADVAPPR